MILVLKTSDACSDKDHVILDVAGLAVVPVSDPLAAKGFDARASACPHAKFGSCHFWCSRKEPRPQQQRLQAEPTSKASPSLLDRPAKPE